MMKKKLLSALLAGAMLPGAQRLQRRDSGWLRRGNSGGRQGRQHLRLNNEFQRKFNAYYPSVSKNLERPVRDLSGGWHRGYTGSSTRNQDGVYQQKLDEALIKQSSASADEKIDSSCGSDYIMKYTDPDVSAAAPDLFAGDHRLGYRETSTSTPFRRHPARTARSAD